MSFGVLAAAALGFAAATALAFREINRTAGLLMAPYVAFLVFANALNFSVARLNPGGRPPRESAATEDLTHPQDMKNPGQDGYQPATQASLAASRRPVSHRARAPLRVLASVPVCTKRRGTPQSHSAGVQMKFGCNRLATSAGSSSTRRGSSSFAFAGL